MTVYRVADMTKKGRKEVCGWLRKLADDLQREPESFAKTFRARYLYSPNKINGHASHSTESDRWEGTRRGSVAKGA